MKDYSIEYAHIYTDEFFDTQHILSISEMKKVESLLESDDATYSKCILIDNYNPINHTLNTEEFLSELNIRNAIPDYLFYEADLVTFGRITIDYITHRRTKLSYEKYIEKHNVYPCSLLTASWYLVRLGVIKYNKIEPAKKLINILPRTFKEVEEKAKLIIKHTHGVRVPNDVIETIYFDADINNKHNQF